MKFLKAVLILSFFFFIQPGFAATNNYTGATAGLWSVNTNWSSGLKPISSDDVTIPNGISVTIDGVAICNSLTLTAGGTSQTLTVTGSLAVTAAISFPAQTAGTKILAIAATTVSCGSISMADHTTSAISRITISTGTLTVNGNISMLGSIAAENQIVFSGAGILNVTGNWTATTNTFTASSSTVNYTGASQTMLGTTYNNVNFSGSGTKTLGAAATIGANGNLNIGSGMVFAMSTFLLTIQGTYINGGSTTSGSGGVTVSGSASKNIGSFTNSGTFSMTKTASTATLTGAIAVGAITINGTTGVLNLGTAFTHTASGVAAITVGTLNGGSSILQLSATGAAFTRAGTFTPSTGTIEYSRAGTQTILGTTYNNLTLSGGSFTKTLGAATTVGTTGTLTIGTGITFAMSTFLLTLQGNLTNNSANATTGSGGVTISGTATQNIGSFTTTGTVSMTKTTNSTATFTGNVGGTGLTLNGSTGTLNLGTGLTHTFTGQFALTVGTLNGNTSRLRLSFATAPTVGGTFTASSGTVEYNGGTQGAAVFTYNNLIISGTLIKTFATAPTVNGVLSMQGSSASMAITSGTLAYGASATLIYSRTTASTSPGVEWINNFAASGGVVIASNTILMSANKTLSSTAPLKIRVGGILSQSTFNLDCSGTVTDSGTFTAGTGTLTFQGNFIKTGTYTGAVTPIIITGTATQSIGSFTTTGLLSMTKASGTATFTGVVSGAGLTINGTAGVLNLGTGLTHTFSGVLTLTLGNLNGGSSTLQLSNASPFSVTSGTFTAGTGTVEYSGAAQTVAVLSYNSLSLSGTGTKTLSASLTSINANLTFAGTSPSATALVGMTIGGNVVLGNGTTFVAGSFTHNVAGNWTNNGGTFTNTGSTINFNGAAQSIAGSAGTTFNNLTKAGTDSLTFSSNCTISNILTLTNSIILGSSTLTLNGTITGAGKVKGGFCGGVSNPSIVVGGSGALGSIDLPVSFRTLNNLTVNKTSGSVTFSSAVNLSGTLTLTEGALICNVKLGFNTSNTPISRTNGTVTMASGSLLSFGSCDQVGSAIVIPNGFFTSAPTIGQIIVDRTNGVTLGNQMISVTGNIINSAGTLATNNNLTLISDVNGTARIDAITGSGITGNVIVQRFIPGGADKRKWRFIGAPVNVSGSIQLSQFIDDILVNAPAAAGGGFDISPQNKASIRTYNETIPGTSDLGWTDPDNITNTVPTGKGMEVFVRGTRGLTDPYDLHTAPDDVVIDFIGTINAGPINFSLTFSNNTQTNADGFNLVANPYPCQIDYEAPSGWTKTNINNFMWAYDPNNTGRYGIYNTSNSLGTNGVTGIIPLGQAFFVKATTDGASIGFNESVKTSTSPFNFFRKATTANHLRIKLSNDSLNSDELLIVFEENASLLGNDDNDASKFFNDRLNLYAVSPDGINLTYSSMPYQHKSDTIKLSAFSFNTTGIMQGKNYLQFSGLETINSGMKIYLLDLFNNSTIDIIANPNYEFEITADVNSHGNFRFRLVLDGRNLTGFNQLKKSQATVLLYPNPAKDYIQIKITEDNNLTTAPITLFNQYGAVVEKQTINLNNNEGQLSLENCANGFYILQVKGSKGIYTKRFIKE